MDNGQSPTWLGAALATAKDVWQAFVVPSALAGWAVWQWLGKSRERRESRETAFMDVQRTEATELRAEREVERRRADAEALEADRWRGIARQWFDAAHNTKHACAGQKVDGHARLVRAGLPGLDLTVIPKLSADVERP